MKKIKYLILMVVVLVGVSCEPTYTKTYSWAYPVAGDWKVKAYVDGVEVDWAGGPFEIKSYNSSFGKDSIWVDDYPVFNTTTNKWSANFYLMKFKTAVKMSDKTFSTTGSTNAIDIYPIKVVVTNGKIVGNDSITMDVVFSDDATTTYQLAGHREVSYEEYMQQ